MKSLLKFLIKKFGFLFEDYPLESGIALIIISASAIYYLRNKIFYLKGESVLRYLINFRTISYLIGFLGISQLLRGLKVYDSILNDFLIGFETLTTEHPIIMGSIITTFGIYLVYDKLKPIDEEPFKKDFSIVRDDDKFYEYKLWIFIAVITIIGISMIIRNL